MRVAIADESAARGGLIDGGLEDPEVLLRTTELEDWFHLDTRALVLERYVE